LLRDDFVSSESMRNPESMRKRDTGSRRKMMGVKNNFNTLLCEGTMYNSYIKVASLVHILRKHRFKNTFPVGNWRFRKQNDT